MIKEFRQMITTGQTIDDISKMINNYFRILKKNNPEIKIIYVAGKVTTNGDARIAYNLEKLKEAARSLRKATKDFVFSPADIFNTKTYWRLNIPKPLHEKDFYIFWRRVLKNGVIDIYFAPKWEQSVGARDEHSTAKKIGLTIHYL